MNTFAREFAKLGGEHFPDPFLDMGSLAMPRGMKNAIDLCLPTGTLIELADFDLRPVEDVRVGDQVLTRTGTIGTVSATRSRHVDEELVELCLETCQALPLRLTSQHRLWRGRSKGNKRRPNGTTRDAIKQLDWKTFDLVPASEVREGDWIATPLPKPLSSAAETHPPGFPLNQSRFGGWVFGMYLAEGCSVHDERGALLASKFSLGEDDERTGILSELVHQLSRQLGRQQQCYAPKARTSARFVTVHDEELPAWMLEHGGEYSDKKKLSAAVFNYGREFLLSTLGGEVDGDGYVQRVKDSFVGLRVATASCTFAYQLQRLSNYLGLTPNLRVQKAEAGHVIGSGQPLQETVGYTVTWDKNDCQAILPYSIKARRARDEFSDFEPKLDVPRGSFVKDGYVYRRVRKVRRVPYSGLVYNLQVEGDHSYIANGVTVANCSFLFYQNDILSQALRRLVSYFVTEIDFGGRKVGSDEPDKWNELAGETGLLSTLQHALLTYKAYGNGFFSMLRPFKRFMRCRCGTSIALRDAYEDPYMAFAWDQKNCQPLAKCPRCRDRYGWEFHDEVVIAPERIRVKNWNPTEIEIVYDPVSEETQYVWVIPAEARQAVRRGNLITLENTNKAILEAVRKNLDFAFYPDALLHLKEPTLPGIKTRGWGIPRLLTSFRQAVYVQVLRRANEVVGMDYVLPVRVITPAPGPGTHTGSRDPLMGVPPHEFMGFVRGMLRRHRRDPASWFSLPFPVQAQLLGGGAQMIAPKDLLDQGQATLLTGLGIPQEFYQGTMRVDSGGLGLRIIESDNRDIVHNGNRFLRWWVRQISLLQSWKEVPATMRRVTLADSADRIMMVLQLMTAGQTSLQTGLQLLGLDLKTEERRKAEEAMLMTENQQDLQRKMDAAGLAREIIKGPGGQGAPAGQPQPAGPSAAGTPPPGAGGMGMSPGGAPGGLVNAYLGQGNAARTPEEVLAMAESLAIELSAYPAALRNSELRQLKQRDELLHSAVTKKLEALRRQQRLYAGALVGGV